jgi:hypothetical protein
MRSLIRIYLFIAIACYCYGAYRWPVSNALYHYCNGTFGEYRYSSNPLYRHFHEGIDIWGVNTLDIIKCTWIGGFEVEEILDLGSGYGYAVTVQHYDFIRETTWVEQNRGSRYLHMLNDPHWDYDEYEIYGDWMPIAHDTYFYNNHLHFEIREPAPAGGDYQDAINPMFVDDNLCPDDGYKPVLFFLYVDGSTDQSHHHQGDAIIDPWNFLDYNFNSYYDSTSTEPFVKCSLPTETRDNDLDDPHFLLSGNCKARFVIKVKDVINVSSSTCAPYWISLYLNTAIALGDEDDPFTEDAEPFYEVKFDKFQESNDEKHDEEDVYHVDEPLISDHDPAQFYYRLYPYDRNEDSNLPSCILSGSWTELKTENLEEGQHRIRIVAEDCYGNIKTGDAHFYKRTGDWVDYCRAFED